MKGSKDDSIYNLFEDVFENEAVENIRKFYRIAKAENLSVELGFSGGKDSIVCYHLCKRSGIPFTAVFNYAFEPPEVVAFIKKNYPDVIIRKKEKSYFQLIKEKGLLPTNRIRYCCAYFKENSKNAIITGVRRQESAVRRNRKMFEVKKKYINKYNDIFSANCTEQGKSSIQLRPILFFSETEIWNYIRKYSLPYPALYDEGQKRCGCMLCPLATLKSNLYYIKKYPNLLPAFYRNMRSKRDFIYNKGRDSEENMSNEPYKYLLFWLSSSFRPSKKEKMLIDEFLNKIEKIG
jgi:phosphoadenosine phosphosulfate reductase